MPSYVVIYDAVAWSTGSLKDNDLEYHNASRGDDVPDSVPAAKIKDWLDTEKFGPHGAIAEKGSRLAALGSVGASVAMDPAESRRRFLEAAGETPVTTDPAGRPNDKPASDQDAGVTHSRSMAARSQAEAEANKSLSANPDGTALDVDSMDKAQLQAMADGLEVEYAKRDSADALREKIKSHMAGPAPTDDDKD